MTRLSIGTLVVPGLHGARGQEQAAEPILAEGRAEFQKHDRVLNEVDAGLERVPTGERFEVAKEDRREWMSDRGGRAGLLDEQGRAEVLKKAQRGALFE